MTRAERALSIYVKVAVVALPLVTAAAAWAHGQLLSSDLRITAVEVRAETLKEQLDLLRSDVKEILSVVKETREEMLRLHGGR